jgi:hypothetical protein
VESKGTAFANQGTLSMTSFTRMVLALALWGLTLSLSPLTAQPTFSPGGVPDNGGPPPGPVFRPTSPVQTAPAPSPAETPVADWGNSQVDIVYREPQDPQFAPIRERLMRRHVLEQLRLFLSPLKLPRKLLVQTEQCNGSRKPYQPGGPVTICYEYVARIEQMAPRNATAGSLPPELMIVGAFVQTVLHEVSQAIFDTLEVPVWGREEDAADKLAGFIMVQFGKEVALKVMIGAAWFFDASDRTWTGNDFASVESPEAQRLFNYLCIAYGSDPATFKFLIDQNLLPVRRAQRCTAEYYQLRAAFLKTIMPYIDQPLLKRVQSASWLMLDAPK